MISVQNSATSESVTFENKIGSFLCMSDKRLLQMKDKSCQYNICLFVVIRHFR